MNYCTRCLYPENAKPTIIFDDDDGVCSGCRYHESRENLEINWEERLGYLEKILYEAKETARKNGSSHDCIIPVSGGKDSHYQVWLMKHKYNMNPLLVTFNHLYNTHAGNKNLENLIAKSGFDLIRYSVGMDSVRKISRYMLKTVGDLTWHYHAGIKTLPFQIAVKYNIPLIIWGEHGFAELTGLVSLEDFVEFTRWSRKEHDMRGYEPEDLIGKEGITRADIAPYIYPSDEEIAATDVRGIYLSNFYDWDAKRHAEMMIKEWGFSPVAYKRERTFNLFAKIEDHANDVHDYLKYLKFGYGRATDDASMEIRHGRMSREEGIEMVREYDAKEPSTLKEYCDFLEISIKEFYDIVVPMRDPQIWTKNNEGEWMVKDSVFNHIPGSTENNVRLNLVNDRTFSINNRNLYYCDKHPPIKTGTSEFDVKSKNFTYI